jgi:hypothetical protein
MTAVIIEGIKITELRAFHSVYAAIHRAHRDAPERFTTGHCTTIITALMGSQAWSWRVVGITHAALQAFVEHDFKHKSKRGITRAHLQPRIKTVEMVLAPEQPLSEIEFIETLLRHDATILCAKGENRASMPEHISFANDDASLFSSQKKVGWSHKEKEQAFLRNLHQSLRGHRRVEIVSTADNKAIGKAKSQAATASSKKNAASKVVSPAPDKIRRIGKGSAWNAGKTMTYNAVRVLGKEYKSVWKAFQALEMGKNSGVARHHHIKFRKELKAKGVNGKQTFTDPRNYKIKYEFTLLGAPI